MSSERRYAREALLIHYFFAADRLDRKGSRRLAFLWEACAQAGMDRSPSPGGDLSLPADPGRAVGGRSLRQRTDAGATNQAMLYRLSGAVGLAVMLAADEGPGRTGPQSAARLRALADDWDTACARAAQTADGSEDGTLIGSVRIHRSLVLPGEAAPVDLAAADLAVVAEEFRGELAPQSLLSRPVDLADGLAVWELTRPREAFPVDRTLFATTAATDAQEGRLDDWVWAAADDRIVPLTRYLVHAATVRDQYRVHADGTPLLDARLRRLQEQGEALTRDWQQVLASQTAGGRVGRRDLARCESIVVRAQSLLAEERLANTTTGDLRAMIRTAEISAAGMRVLGTGADGTPKALEDDAQCHALLTPVLDDNVTYLEIARDQVAETSRIASETAAQRLQSHQQYLTLLQTSVIGALLMTLTAVQTLAYKLPVPDRLHAPLIALLGSLGLSLPLVVARRWRGGAGGWAGSVLEMASLTATGAAAGWLTGRAVGHTVLLVLGGTALFIVAGTWLTRRSSA
ncbi:CATRA conflict system CASPASE/TPR repeat-associated protein [Kitasatospora sp. NPDC101235]|uniref:CATRA conflict system CASPASE/TPR repeat-associated protein n=1 Tax=Kitasatospora sp. NPDC101235 TaxID=3364101 RepID=UPI00380C1D11